MSVQRSLRVMPRFNGFDLSKFRCSKPSVDESNCVVKDFTVVKIIDNKLSACSRNVSDAGNVLKANSVLVLDDFDEICNVRGEHLNQVKQSTPEQRALTADNCDNVHNFSMYLRQCEADEQLFAFLEQTMMAHEDLLNDVQLMVSSMSSVICTRSRNETSTSDAEGQSHPDIVDVINNVSVLPNNRINNDLFLSSLPIDKSFNMNKSNVLIDNLLKNVPDTVPDNVYNVPEDNIFNNFVGFKEANSQNFSGFVNNCSRSEKLLDEMRDIIDQSRRTIAERKRNSRDFRREIWEYRQSKNNFSIDSNSTIGSEVTDIVPELPLQHTYRLRSRGPVSSPIKNLGRI